MYMYITDELRQSVQSNGSPPKAVITCMYMYVHVVYYMYMYVHYIQCMYMYMYMYIIMFTYNIQLQHITKLVFI